MERELRINWPALVEEAKQRRKTLGLTQVRLAELAKVSTPTISRFEIGESNIQLSSIINILSVLGMNDQRTLTFIDPNPRYDAIRDSIIFTGEDAKETIQCCISKEALDDHFNGEKNGLLNAYKKNQEAIQQMARRKYLFSNLENKRLVLLRSSDFG